MKVVLDECLPKKLCNLFPDYDIQTVPQLGLAGLNDTDLLVKLDELNVDVFITIDGNIEYQQKFDERNFGTVLIRAISNRYEDLRHLQGSIDKSINSCEPGQVVRIV